MKNFIIALVSKFMIKKLASLFLKAIIKATRNKIDDNFLMLYEALQAGDDEAALIAAFAIVESIKRSIKKRAKVS